MKRCDWVTDDQDYLEYHDREWGVVVHDDRKLFEMLLLEGAQAGLSWLTILRRRLTYRTAYDDFDPVIIAGWDEEKIADLLQDPGIVRKPYSSSFRVCFIQIYAVTSQAWVTVES